MMPKTRLAYMPLITYPDIATEEAVIAATSTAMALDTELQVTTFSVEIPAVASPIGNFLLNIPDLIRTTEEYSQNDCLRLERLVQRHAEGRIGVQCSSRKLPLGSAGSAAASEARYFDLSLLPWVKDSLVLQELAETVVFDAGRPAILVPSSATSNPIKDVAIAWDGSRVAARALADVMPLLTPDSHITILTVQNEKQLEGRGIAETLALSLRRRGFQAQAQNVELEGGNIAETLQDAALNAESHMLAMGGFGHTRLRDFVLGGATKGVLSELRLPVLMSH
jgi:nucleotide-binding universal stress UspA family protein